jgi:DNA polymerase
MDDRDPRDELADIAASTRALIAWYAESGLDGVVADDPDGAFDALSATARTLQSPRSPARAAPAKPEPQVPVVEARAQQAPPPQAPQQPAPQPQQPPQAPPASRAPVVPSSPSGRPAPVSAAAPVSVPPSVAFAPEERRARLALLQEEVRGCEKCKLAPTRRNTVFSRGNPLAELCFVGEGPGADEDEQGEPFVGKAGQLLDRMIAAMGYARDEVYICNVVKCRPPENRKPEPEEMAACASYLTQQLSLVKPKVIIALGATAVTGLIGATEGITRLRGKWRLYKGQIPIMPTFHPAYLLRQPAAKKDVWDDLQQVMKHLGKSPPEKRG